MAFHLAFHIQNEDQRRPVAYAAAVKLFVALPGRAAAARGTAPLAQCVLDARASASSFLIKKLSETLFRQASGRGTLKKEKEKEIYPKTYKKQIRKHKKT